MTDRPPEPRAEALNDIATLLFAFWHHPAPSTRAQIEAFITRHVDGVTIGQLRQCDLSPDLTTERQARHEAEQQLMQPARTGCDDCLDARRQAEASLARVVGLSLRALTLTLWKEWAEKADD